MTSQDAENEKRRVIQIQTNLMWVIEKLDEIHDALCPGMNGTWQQRVEQAVEAAKRTAKRVAEEKVGHHALQSALQRKK
jgi:hypothetical protein